MLYHTQRAASGTAATPPTRAYRHNAATAHRSPVATRRDAAPPRLPTNPPTTDRTDDPASDREPAHRSNRPSRLDHRRPESAPAPATYRAAARHRAIARTCANHRESALPSTRPTMHP